VLPDKFIVGGIIAKLPLSWRNFATSLKHKRHEFSVIDRIWSLDVEEKAREKYTCAQGAEGSYSLPTSRRRPIRRKKHSMFVAIQDTGHLVAQTALTSIMGRAARPQMLSLAMLR
jgi:hypothetical protein